MTNVAAVVRLMEDSDMSPSIRDGLFEELEKGNPESPELGVHGDVDHLCVDVLYINHMVSVDSVKDCIALRKLGYSCTILYRTDWGLEPVARRHGVNLVQHDDMAALAWALRQAQCRVVLGRKGRAGESALASILVDAPLVYKPYDFNLRYPPELNSEYNLDAERFVLSRARGVMHFHHESIADYLRERGLYSGLCEQIRPGCMDEFRFEPRPARKSEQQEGPHLVYAAGVARSYSDSRRNGDGNVYDDFVTLLDQDVTLDTYVAYIRESDEKVGLKHYFELQDKYPGFTMNKTLPYEELIQVLPRYDFAYNIFFTRTRTMRLKDEVFHRGNSNQFYTYIDAGVPILCSDESWGMTELVEPLGIGMSVSIEGLKDLGARLRDVDLDAMRRNVELARPQLMYPIERLDAFMGNVVG